MALYIKGTYVVERRGKTLLSEANPSHLPAKRPVKKVRIDPSFVYVVLADLFPQILEIKSSAA